MFNKKQTKFWGNSYSNVQKISSSRSVEWTMSCCKAGKCLYSSGTFGLHENVHKLITNWINSMLLPMCNLYIFDFCIDARLQ